MKNWKKIKNKIEKNKFLQRELLDFKVIHLCLALLALIILSLVLSLNMSLVSSFRIVFGSVYSLFLPGYLVSHAILNKKEIDLLERFAVSFALSISIVPLIVFYLNLIGLKVSTLNSVFTILGVSIVSIVIIQMRQKKDK